MIVIENFKCELKKFFSTPKNFIFLFLGPMFFTIFFGFVYQNDYLNDISMVVLDYDNTSISRKIVEDFDRNGRFDIVYFAKNQKEFKEMIESRKVKSAIFIPHDFEKNIKSSKGATLGFYVDETNIAIGNNALSVANNIINSINKDISLSYIKERNSNLNISSIEPFKITSRILYDSKLSYKYYVMPGIILVLVQQLFLSVFVVNYISDKNNIFYKSLIHIIIAVLSYYGSLMILENILKISIVGNKLLIIFLVSIYLFSLVGIAMVIGNIAKTKLFATQFCMMLSIPTFFTAGYIWPLFEMNKFIVIILKGIWPLIYMVSPLRDLIVKGQLPNNFINNFVGILIFALFWIFIASKVQKSGGETSGEYNYGHR